MSAADTQYPAAGRHSTSSLLDRGAEADMPVLSQEHRLTVAFSRFHRAGSRPTWHEWRGSLLDPSQNDVRDLRECACAGAPMISPFHGPKIPAPEI